MHASYNQLTGKSQAAKITRSGLHHGVHGAPAGHVRLRPEAFAAPLAAAGLALADAVHEVERVERGPGAPARRDRRPAIRKA